MYTQLKHHLKHHGSIAGAHAGGVIHHRSLKSTSASTPPKMSAHGLDDDEDADADDDASVKTVDGDDKSALHMHIPNRGEIDERSLTVVHVFGTA